MVFTPGDRVELVATNDPYTRLRPGDRGTITSVSDRPEPTIDIQWDNGSTLASPWVSGRGLVCQSPC